MLKHRHRSHIAPALCLTRIHCMIQREWHEVANETHDMLRDGQIQAGGALAQRQQQHMRCPLDRTAAVPRRRVGAAHIWRAELLQA